MAIKAKIKTYEGAGSQCLTSLKKNDLLQIATKLNIGGLKRKKKAELFELLKDKVSPEDIPKKSVGSLVPLPSDNEGVFISERGDISVIIPERERSVCVAWGDAQATIVVKTPKLLFRFASTFDQYMNYFLYEVRIKNNRIKTRPYRLSNVYDNGRICFGDNETYGKSPRAIFQLFWNGVFTPDLSDYKLEIGSSKHLCETKKHHRECKTVHYHYHVATKTTCHCRNKNSYDINIRAANICPRCSSFTEEFSDEEKKLSSACLCCIGRCLCRCTCECCQLTCRCTCECGSYNEIKLKLYIERINSYRETLKFSDKSKVLLGARGFHFPRKTKEIFVSSDKKLAGLLPGKCAIGIPKEIEDAYLVAFGEKEIYKFSKEEVKS